jgi:hypothetical protein
MIEEFQRIWKKAFVVSLDFYLQNCLEGLSETRETLNDHSSAEIRTEYLQSTNLLRVLGDKIKQDEE